MPNRRLVVIGKPADPAPLPTVAQYFKDLAMRQGEDIRLLKERATLLAQERAARRTKSRKSVREESWRLHPVVVTGGAAKNEEAKKRLRPAKKKTKSK